MKQLPEAYQEFERFCKTKGFRQVERAETPYGEFFIAETDKEFDKFNFPEYPEGFYQVFWCFSSKASKGKLDIGRYLEFSSLHDIEMDDESRREARLNAARADAEYFLNKNIEVGRYH